MSDQSAQKQIGAYQAELCAIAAVPVADLHALSLSHGWPHREEDWLRLLEIGAGLAARDEIGRVLGTAMWFPAGDDHATIGMTLTSPRLQGEGLARWLTEGVLAQAGPRTARLQTAWTAQRLYLSLGFLPRRMVVQHQGIVTLAATRPPPAIDAEIRPLTGPLDPALLDLDRAAFGAPRPAVLGAVLEQSTGVGLWREGRLTAFALCRPFGRGHVIGPVVAHDDADAIAVTWPCLAAQAGRFVRLDTYQEQGSFVALLEATGLTRVDTLLTMTRGGDPFAAAVPGAPASYGLASHALC